MSHVHDGPVLLSTHIIRIASDWLRAWLKQ